MWMSETTRMRSSVTVVLTARVPPRSRTSALSSSLLRLLGGGGVLGDGAEQEGRTREAVPELCARHLEHELVVELSDASAHLLKQLERKGRIPPDLHEQRAGP